MSKTKIFNKNCIDFLFMNKSAFFLPRLVYNVQDMVKELKLSTTWIGATELVMSSSYLKRTIICISPKNNLVSGKNFYHDVYGREYLKQGPPLVIKYYESHYQVEHWL